MGIDKYLHEFSGHGVTYPCWNYPHAHLPHHPHPHFEHIHRKNVLLTMCQKFDELGYFRNYGILSRSETGR